MRDEEIVAAAQVICARLRVLLGEDAAGVEERLSALLARAVVDVDAVIELLGRREETRAAMREELARVRFVPRDGPPGFAAVTGLGDPAAPIFYRCGECGYTYPVFEVGEPVPASCQEGHGPLVRVE
ncbi:hypothetical protein [Streptosporangium sp. NPDC048865]|uniref:hypothetical protein n=1 Tax=Streptosporangium sp. NPDC048865 TaxID=3155766 RepID=UPI00343F2A32